MYFKVYCENLEVPCEIEFILFTCVLVNQIIARDFLRELLDRVTFDVVLFKSHSEPSVYVPKSF